MDIVAGINKKNVKAFRIFFEDNFANVVIFADKYLDNQDVAADIAQECFIQLWCSDAEFSSIEGMRAFIYTVARNLSLNHLKHEAIVIDWKNRNVVEDILFTRDNLIEQETYRLVYEAIGQLAKQSKRIILLSLRGYSNQEIADIMNISINTVRTLKQNAYKRLRILLKEHFYVFLLMIN